MVISSMATSRRRLGSGASALLGVALVLLAAVSPARADAWSDFIAGLWPEAQKEGVSRATFDAAFRGVTPDYSLPDLIVAGKKRDEHDGRGGDAHYPILEAIS